MAQTGVRTQPYPSQRWMAALKQVAIVIGGSAVIAVCARFVLPLPFTPVPLTLANFGVLLVGLALGSKRGFTSACVYLAWGGMGLPVFSPTGVSGLVHLLGPTGGYLVAYPMVAFLAGWISERGTASFARNVVAAVAAEVLLFAAGTSWLQIMTGSWRSAVAFGLAPFLFAEIIKIMLAAAAARKLQHSI